MPTQGADARNQDGPLMMGKDANNTVQPIGVSAGGGIATSQASITPLGYQQITSLSLATALTVPTGAKGAILTAETQAIRWRDDGTNPTATVGMPLPVNTPFTYMGDLSAIKVIEQTASAKLNVSYFK